MKALNLSAMLIFLLSLFIFCGQSNSSSQQELPKTLTKDESELDFSSERSSISIVNELYFDVLKNDVAIKQIDDEYRILNERNHELEKKNRSYFGKNAEYYEMARILAGSLADSVLRQHLNSLLESAKKCMQTESKPLNR